MKKLVLIAATAVIVAIVARLLIQKCAGGEAPTADVEVQIIET